MEQLLRMENITKRFGTFYANRDISFDVEKGEVHTLFGENGAGKSTLMNILFGLYQPSAGEIWLNGEKVSIHSASEATKHKIGMVHQHFMLVEALTVFENIILGDNQFHSPFIKREEAERKIRALAEKYGLAIDLTRRITDISVGEQQRVEIIKALYRDADLLILDEPTAVLTDPEVDSLFEIINKFKAEGKSVIFISHKMREVMNISDRITVLRNGKKVATVKKEEVTVKQLASMMIGREFKEEVFEKHASTSEYVLKLDGVSYNKASKHSGLDRVSFGVRAGEIVGIAGVDGNGQSQLAQVMTGILKPDEGTLQLGGTQVRSFTPGEMIRMGVSHIPEDRNRMGLVGNMTVEENLLLKTLDLPDVSRREGAFLQKEAISKKAESYREKYDIRNQQKVILARELEIKPKLLIASHPTRGLDVGATEFVHRQMIQAREEGCAILLISADFDEILNLSDRILVMFEGKIMGEFSGTNPPIEEISMALSGKRA